MLLYITMIAEILSYHADFPVALLEKLLSIIFFILYGKFFLFVWKSKQFVILFEGLLNGFRR